MTFWRLLLTGWVLMSMSEIVAAGSPPPAELCPKPALSRLKYHTIAPGETLEGVAQRYSLIPATLMGMNPALRQGGAPVGTRIVIPPYNGIRVAVPPGQSLKAIAATYKVRPDVLFEVNGCQSSPKVVFVPGVNWSPIAPPGNTSRSQPQASKRFSHYPLPAIAPLGRGYGWQVSATGGRVMFHSGVDLEAAAGTPVLAVAQGVVAFAGKRGQATLVVINHAGGYQTRYAELATTSVTSGQSLKPGQRLGTVGATAARPHLHFEVRLNSPLGWVAQDPEVFLRAMTARTKL